jgi:hypothetical protein
MKEHPILFSGPMVNAILEGRKTQTRRVIKPQPPKWVRFASLAFGSLWNFVQGGKPICRNAPAKCPYGQPGDRLWVRETFVVEVEEDGNKPPFSDGRPVKFLSEFEGESFDWLQPHYRATDPQPELCCEHEKCEGGPCVRPWWPSIFMPRWASRITLEVTSVRVERIQDCSEADAVAEGGAEKELLHPPDGFDPDNVNPPGAYGYVSGLQPFPEGKIHPTAAQAFAERWDYINAKRGFGWEKNPWVWVVEFKRVEGESGR